MELFTCARSSTPIDEHQCPQLVLAASTHDELEICRSCARGHELAKLSLTVRLIDDMPPVTSSPVRFSPDRPVVVEPAKQEAKNVEQAAPVEEPKPIKTPAGERPPKKPRVRQEAPKLFPKLLSYVLRRYPTFKTHGFNFLHSVSQSQFAYTGSQENMLREAKQLGLSVTARGKRYTLVVDAAAKTLAKS